MVHVSKEGTHQSLFRLSLCCRNILCGLSQVAGSPLVPTEAKDGSHLAITQVEVKAPCTCAGVPGLGSLPPSPGYGTKSEPGLRSSYVLWWSLQPCNPLVLSGPQLGRRPVWRTWGYGM